MYQNRKKPICASVKTQYTVKHCIIKAKIMVLLEYVNV